MIPIYFLRKLRQRENQQRTWRAWAKIPRGWTRSEECPVIRRGGVRTRERAEGNHTGEELYFMNWRLDEPGGVDPGDDAQAGFESGEAAGGFE